MEGGLSIWELREPSGGLGSPYLWALLLRGPVRIP